MRTQKLLIAAAAALAAGVVTSQAQVYSQNIVGYVNTVLPNGLTLVNNPLSGTTNAADSVLPGLQVGDSLLVWNGAGYVSYLYVGPGGNAPSTETWQDPNGNPLAAPNLVPGQGFFYNNGQGVTETNTFVGTVVLTNTISLPNGLDLVASSVPISDIADGTNIALPLQVGDSLLLWNGAGYVSYLYVGPGGNAPSTATWQDPNGNPLASPTISVGEGFFYNNGQGATETWTQNLVVQ